MTNRIVDIDLGLPQGWVGWRAGAAADALDVVRSLGASEHATAVREDAVSELEGILTAEGRVAGALWMPDPTDGPWGQLTVSVYLPGSEEPATPQSLLDALAEPRRIGGSRVFDHSVGLGEAEVGPMVVQVEVRGDARTGAVRCSLAQSVFPQGGREVVRIVYTTQQPAVFDALARESLTVAAHLTVDREA